MAKFQGFAGKCEGERGKVRRRSVSAKATEANWVAAIVKAKSAVTDAQTKLDRRKEMFKDEILDREDLDTAQDTYDQAVADLNAAEAEHAAAVNNVRSAEAASKQLKPKWRCLLLR